MDADNHPSFSSSLLDHIYRSIDQTVDEQSAPQKQSKSRKDCFGDDHDHDHDHDAERRACLMQKWMDNKVRQKPVVVGLERSSMRYEGGLLCLNSSCSSSCDSSCCCCRCRGGFSEECVVVKPKPKPKPIRTRHDKHRSADSHTKHEAKFGKTKSKALKMYSDLKQPISPGGRLATFLNSLFTSKKPNTHGAYTEATTSRLSKSACSSASSFSPSCLTNISSSKAKSSNRSVTFYPVTLLVGQDSHKSLHEEETSFKKFATQSCKNKEAVKLKFSDENRHISEAARNLLKNYQKKVEETRSNNEFDDDASDSSSDLFELDNLSAVGMHRYREELPVYGTTQLDTNRIIM